MLCRRELITIVTPLSRPGSAKTAASVCLYSVYRKQDRPLFTAALEQTSKMCRPPSSSCVRGRACGLPHPASGLRSRPSVTLHVCVLTGAPRRRRRSRCPPFHAPTPHDVDRLSSGIRREGGGGDSPARRARADGRCTSLVALPSYAHPDRFERATAGYVDRPQTGWGPVIGQERRRVRPMIAPPTFAPPPAIQLRSPT